MSRKEELQEQIRALREELDEIEEAERQAGFAELKLSALLEYLLLGKPISEAEFDEGVARVMATAQSFLECNAVLASSSSGRPVAAHGDGHLVRESTRTRRRRSCDGRS